MQNMNKSPQIIRLTISYDYKCMWVCLQGRRTGGWRCIARTLVGAARAATLAGLVRSPRPTISHWRDGGRRTKVNLQRWASPRALALRCPVPLCRPPNAQHHVAATYPCPTSTLTLCSDLFSAMIFKFLYKYYQCIISLFVIMNFIISFRRMKYLKNYKYYFYKNDI